MSSFTIEEYSELLRKYESAKEEASDRESERDAAEAPFDEVCDILGVEDDYDSAPGVARRLIQERDCLKTLLKEKLEIVRNPTEAMLDAARDWSYKVYGKPIGNDAAIGCWQAMFEARIIELKLQLGVQS